MRILGIESSADETAAAVVEDGYKLLSSVVSSSLDLHTAFGGIVPEIAARSHIEVIIQVIKQALDDAGCEWDNIDAIAVTNRPGLIGSLLIGVLTARTLAITKNKPIFGINHVLAHIYANFITEADSRQQTAGSRKARPTNYRLPSAPPKFPFLALIVSGGHTQLMLYKSHEVYDILGQTRDDAVGEAFDKVAKILGLPYPGGPAIAAAAERGNPDSVKLPKAKLESSYDFSFSGLKTAVLRAAQSLAGKDFAFPSTELSKVLDARQKADLAASFQKTAVVTLSDAVVAAERQYRPETVLLAGGVAANQALRQELQSRLKTTLLYPDIKLCTDNAAMIASAAYYQQQPAADPYKLAVIPSL